jgi:cytochrome c
MKAISGIAAVLMALSVPALAAPDMGTGLALAKKSQCLICHAVDHKVIGPAWNDVSARYNKEIRSGRKKADVVAQLVAKVSRGGTGNWTQVTGGMSMPANAPRVSQADITALVEFILSLKK